MPRDIVAAGTRASTGRRSRVADLEAIARGKDASLLVLAADPLADVQTLSEPVRAYVRGALQTP